MDSSQIEADGRQVLGVGIVHMNSFNDIYTLDSQYVVWVLRASHAAGVGWKSLPRGEGGGEGEGGEGEGRR